jgi:hypothetical protein
MPHGPRLPFGHAGERGTARARWLWFRQVLPQALTQCHACRDSYRDFAEKQRRPRPARARSRRRAESRRTGTARRNPGAAAPPLPAAASREQRKARQQAGPREAKRNGPGTRHAPRNPRAGRLGTATQPRHDRSALVTTSQAGSGQPPASRGSQATEDNS